MMDIAKVAWVSLAILLGIVIVGTMLRNKTEKNVNQRNINVVYAMIALFSAATFTPIHLQIGDTITVSTDQQLRSVLERLPAEIGAIDDTLAEGLELSQGTAKENGGER